MKKYKTFYKIHVSNIDGSCCYFRFSSWSEVKRFISLVDPYFFNCFIVEKEVFSNE